MLLESAAIVRRRGHAVEVLTGGGTGSSATDIALHGLTELQPGSYVFMDCTYRRIHWALPFGGVKDSGYGRDSGIESVLENTQLKTAWIDLA